MNEILALPVNGDAFLMIRDIGAEQSDKYTDNQTVRILVDGGGSNKVVKELNSLGVEQLDIIVCTHSDSDHIKGILKLFEDTNKPTKELWVPGEWFSITEELKLNKSDFYKELIKEILKNHDNLDGVIIENVDFVEHLITITLEHLEHLEHLEYLEYLDRFEYFIKRLNLYDFREKVLQYSKNFNLIMNIVNLAHANQVICRWFQFDPSKRFGGEKFLKPINSVEVCRTHSIQEMMLTIENENALVFHSPFKDKYDVLFSSDSNFNFNFNTYGLKPDKLLFTAPHHGSKNNDNAFDEIMSISNNKTVCIKSRTSSVAIGKKFLNLPFKRYCNSCNRPKNSARQVVNFNLSTWKLTTCKVKCKCVLGR